MRKLLTFLLFVVGLYAQQDSLTFQVANPSPVSNVSVFTTGVTGTTTYFYFVVANYPSGSVISNPFMITNANDTLNGSNFNTIIWTPVPYATTYDVLRSTGSTISFPCGACLVASGVTGNSRVDQSNTVTAYTYSAAVPATAILRLNDRDFITPRLEWMIGTSGVGVFGPLPGLNNIGYSLPFPNVPLGTNTIGFRSDIGNFPQTATASSGLAWPVSAGQFSIDVPASAQGASSQGAAALSLYARSATSNYPSGGVGVNGGVAAGGLRIETFSSGTLGGQWGITIQTNGCDQNCQNAGAIAFSQQYQVGAEIDLRNHITGSVQNSGVWVVNKSSFTATNSDAFRLDSVVSANCGAGGAVAACVPMGVAFHTTSNAALVALQIDPLGAGVTNLPTQPIQWRSFDPGGVVRTAALNTNPNGDFVYAAANNGNNALVAHTWVKLGVGNISTLGSAGTFTTASDNYSRLTYTAQTDGVSATWATTAFRPGIIDETASAGGVSMTTPTAANIVARLKSDGAQCFVGNAFNLTIANVGGVNAVGILAGANVTFQHVAASLAAGQKTVLTVIINNCGSGTEAVSIIGDGVRT